MVERERDPDKYHTRKKSEVSDASILNERDYLYLTGKNVGVILRAGKALGLGKVPGPSRC